MLTPTSLQHLKHFTCPHCSNALGRFHAYPIGLATLLSRLTDSCPMHLECAKASVPVGAELDVIWVVKASSPDSPSGRLFEQTPGDHMIHLFSPASIVIEHNHRPASYEAIYEAMLSEVKAARLRSDSNEEIKALMEQITWLHRYLPPVPEGFEF